ncbi:hypothetical protein [Mucilaginibacter sp.]
MNTPSIKKVTSDLLTNQLMAIIIGFNTYEEALYFDNRLSEYIIDWSDKNEHYYEFYLFSNEAGAYQFDVLKSSVPHLIDCTVLVCAYQSQMGHLEYLRERTLNKRYLPSY